MLEYKREIRADSRWQAIGITFAQRRLRGNAATVLLFCALFAAYVWLQPGILTLPQIGLALQTALPLILVSASQALVMLTGGIDVSVGGAIAVGNTLTATWLGGLSGSHEWRLVLVVLIGLGLGLANGALIIWAKIEPFIVTLASWSIFGGIALAVQPTAGGETPSSLSNWAAGDTFALPTSVILLAVLLLLWWYFRGTVAVTAVYSVGSDPERARLSGVRVDRVKLCVYAVSALVATLAGVYLALITQSGDATLGDAYILPSVAAAVIGGTSLAGGIGGVGQAVAGAMMLTFIQGITAALILPPWVSLLVSAVLLLVIVGMRSSLEERRRAS